MSSIAHRAEQIASFLASHELGSAVTAFDINGRQRAVDFHLTRPDGTDAALEVTLIADPAAIQWEALASSDRWLWPADAAWVYRPHSYRVSYKRARQAAVRLAHLCDEQETDSWPRLRPASRKEALELWRLAEDLGGDLTRTTLREKTGIRLSPATSVEFVDDECGSLVDLLEEWANRPHIRSHVTKLLADAQVSERHLFLIPVSDELPSQFFTDDFAPPSRPPRGYERLDGLWVWSNYWHRFLRMHNDEWTWVAFPKAAAA